MKSKGSGRRLSRLIVDMYQRRSFLAQVTSDYIKGASISIHELPRRRVFSEIRGWSLGPCSGCLHLPYSTSLARKRIERREDRRYENAKPRQRRGRTTLCSTHGRAAPATWGTHHSVLRWRCAGREEPWVPISDGYLPCYRFRAHSLRAWLPYLPG